MVAVLRDKADGRGQRHVEADGEGQDPPVLPVSPGPGCPAQGGLASLPSLAIQWAPARCQALFSVPVLSV